MQQRVIEECEKLGVYEGTLRRKPAERTWPEELLVEQVHLCALGEKVARSLTESRDLGSALQRCAEALVEHLDAAPGRRLWATLHTGDGAASLCALPGTTPNRKRSAAISSPKRVAISPRVCWRPPSAHCIGSAWTETHKLIPTPPRDSSPKALMALQR
jgi:hypothetical protein